MALLNKLGASFNWIEYGVQYFTVQVQGYCKCWNTNGFESSHTGNAHSMVSNETFLMCGDTVTNTPLYIHQSTQIIQIHVSNLILRYVCYREIRWHDYVLHYILKYIPTYVRIYWTSTTTPQTQTQGPKFFYQNFFGHQQYPYLQYACFWWYWVP